MIEHNLLSIQDKHVLSQHLWFLIAKRFAITVVTVLVLVTGVLLFSKYLLSAESAELDERIDSSLQETVLKQGGPLQDNIRELNGTLSSFQTIQSAYTPVSPFLYAFFEHIGEGISLYSVTLNIKERTVIIEGTARTRNDMLKLRGDLEKFYAFAELRSSGSDLTQRENIDFTISATLSSNFSSPPASPQSTNDDASS